jgi:hypothetical protein
MMQFPVSNSGLMRAFFMAVRCAVESGGSGNAFASLTCQPDLPASPATVDCAFGEHRARHKPQGYHDIVRSDVLMVAFF